MVPAYQHEPFVNALMLVFFFQKLQDLHL